MKEYGLDIIILVLVLVLVLIISNLPFILK